MTASEPRSVRTEAAERLTAGLRELLARYGDATLAASAPVADAVQHLREALSSGSEAGNNLSPLDIARIRLGKFAAARLPPEVFRDPTRLAAMRAEILVLARAWLRDEARAP